MHILAPLIRGRKGEHKGVIDEIRKEGFLRVRVDGEVMTVDDKIILNKNKKHTIEVVVDRLIMKDSINERLTESIELALKIGSGLIVVNELPNKEHLFSEHFACPDCEHTEERR